MKYLLASTLLALTSLPASACYDAAAGHEGEVWDVEARHISGDPVRGWVMVLPQGRCLRVEHPVEGTVMLDARLIHVVPASEKVREVRQTMTETVRLRGEMVTRHTQWHWAKILMKHSENRNSALPLLLRKFDSFGSKDQN